MSWQPRLIKLKDGFTIVELLVVVAIAGAIVTMAVPSYCKYSATAKQAQAKNILGAIWVAEQSFAITQHSYSACLKDIGVDATIGQPTLYYGFGFNYTAITQPYCGPSANATCFATSWPNPGTPVACSGPVTTDGEASFQATANMDPANPTKPGGAMLSYSGLPPSGWINHNNFTAMAMGNISACNSNYDKWVIDQTKTISNVKSAL